MVDNVIAQRILKSFTCRAASDHLLFCIAKESNQISRISFCSFYLYIFGFAILVFSIQTVTVTGCSWSLEIHIHYID